MSSNFRSANDIRTDFIEFFQSKQHKFIPSSPVVPHDDPTLLFANAGMNQFKPIFLNTLHVNSPLNSVSRACNSQKCIRAGGKHNDLDDVGKDVYHHTFFEMLGSWSFGDYFKQGAITMAWDLLVNKWGLDPARLYVTYFAGTDEVPADTEARDIWLNIDERLPASHVLPYGMKENFWEMGETGPCGPCSEIHYDRLNTGRNASHLVNADDPDVLEIWNLVFIQYNRLPNKTLALLPAKHIDTGMGFERIVSVLQDKSSNYDTDVFIPYFEKIYELSGGKIEKYKGLVFNLNNSEDCNVDVAYRVVADHIRTLSVAISDGGRPDNVGRGYVLRRILRRAIRFSSEHLMLGVGKLSELVDVADKSLSVFYPEITKNNALIKKIINEEEINFLNTLKRGKMVLDRCIESNYKGLKKFKFDSVVAWKLYDTFGFPVDLTQIMVEEKGGFIDMVEFEKFKTESINKNKNKVDSVTTTDRFSNIDLNDIPPTDDSLKYDDLNKNTEFTFTVLKVVEKEEEDKKDVIGVVFDKTNFYAEEGGQESDSGVIVNAKTNEIFSVVDVQKIGNHIIHIVKVDESLVLSVNDTFYTVVNVERRKKLMSNHTATHLLNFALRSTFNQEVYSNNNEAKPNLNNLIDADQKGSLVAEDRLRFDFKYNEAMTKEQIELTEQTVNSIINKNYAVNSFSLPLEQAKNVPGLRAMFDEHYPDPVRVVAIGVDKEQVVDPTKTSAFNYSIELCGGTHVKTTKEIGQFVIVSESAIARGIRRIVAVTNEQAEECLNNYTQLNENFEKFLTSINSTNALTSIKKKNELSAEILTFMNETNTTNLPYTKKSFFTEQLRKIKQKLDEYERQCVKQAGNKFTANLKEKLQKRDSSSQQYVVITVTNEDATLLTMKSVDACVKKLNLTDCVVAVVTKDQLNDKTATYINVPKEMKQDAKEILSKVYEACDLSVKFGGKKDCAQGTVPSTDSYEKILETLIEKLKI